MLRSSFAKERLNDLEATERAVNIMFEIIGLPGADGWTEVVNMQPLVYRFVLDTSTKFLFGKSVESQKAFVAKQADKGRDDPEGQDMGRFALFLGFRLRWLAFLGTSSTFRKATATIEKFLTYAIRERLSEDDSTTANSDSSLLSDMAEKTRNADDLRAQLTGLLFAGRDATGSLILLTLLLLSRHPKVYQKVRDLVLEKFDQPAGAVLDNLQLQQFAYLRHVLYETLRLCSVLPLNSRIATRYTVLPEGGGEDGKQPIVLHKGQQIQLNLYAMHRRKDLWGDDAHEFKPNRWKDPKRSTLLEDG